MEKPIQLKIIAHDGNIINRPFHSHYFPNVDVSYNYDKILAPFLHYGIAIKDFVGDSESVLCDAVEMAKITTNFLQKDPRLFEDDKSIPNEWYQ